MKIIHETPHFLVLIKPPLWYSQGPNEPSIVSWLQAKWGRPYVGLIHRLDYETSGLLLIAKRSKAAGRLSAMMREKTIQRQYEAILERAIEPTTWDSPIEEKQARTQVLSTKGRWASFLLETGRKRQIRIHASRHASPILGDYRHGAVLPWSHPGIALHAWHLAFQDPITQEPLSFEYPAPWRPLDARLA